MAVCVSPAGTAGQSLSPLKESHPTGAVASKAKTILVELPDQRAGSDNMSKPTNEKHKQEEEILERTAPCTSPRSRELGAPSVPIANQLIAGYLAGCCRRMLC